MRIFCLPVAVVLFAAPVAIRSAHAENGRPAIAEPIASATDPTDRMTGYQLNRRYGDVVEIDGKTAQRTIEYGFDYDKRTTVKKTFDADGRLLDESEEPSTTLRASAAEEARLVELVRTHPQLAEKMAEPGLHIYAGGFVLREPGHPYCWLHSRCIRVVVSKGDGSIRHVYALVDLVSDRVIEPFHVPTPGSPGSKTAKEQ